MNIIIRQPWHLPEHQHTDPTVYQNRQQHRRDFLKSLGRGIAVSGSAPGLLGLLGCMPSAEEIDNAGQVAPLSQEYAKLYPAPRNKPFRYGRPETDRTEAAQYTNFYEFSGSKDVYNYVGSFQPSPWEFEVTGLCGKPRKWDMDDVYRHFSLEERAYRHRCVETWAMCVPWTGFPLKKLLEEAEPRSTAKYVQFQTAMRPREMPAISSAPDYPWPYTEGLTMDEAMNELVLVVTGIYGQPLPKQHGAPIRIVIPWKYGYKSIKSIVKIQMTDKQPKTFWNTLLPSEYDFPAIVDPQIPHPRWSQESEWMLGTGKTYPTVKYNGYGDYVGSLYS